MSALQRRRFQCMTGRETSLHGTRITPISLARYGVAFAYGVLINTAAAATEGSVPLSLEAHGLLDLRYLHTEGSQSWLDQDLGKFRFGGNDGGNDYLRLNEAALSVQARLNWVWSGTVTIKSAARQTNAVDLSEAFLRFHPAPQSAVSVSARLGYFFPPLSMENTGVAWSSQYTLTSSAINSWIGEELRVFGAEAQFAYRLANGDRIGVFAAGFANNDTAGTLLAYRGWSLHDYEATLTDRLALPLRTGLQSVLQLQASTTRPFVEVDGRPGYYAGLSLERPGHAKLRAVYYDNQARPAAIAQGQYAWHTRFRSLGLTLDLPWSSVLIGQWLQGRTQMGEQIAQKFAVDTSFWAYSLLLSKAYGKHRYTVRFDRFGTAEDDYLPQQDNRESGQAWTLNYNYTWSTRHQMSFELTQLASHRSARRVLLEAPEQEETLWQVAYRWFF
jgi:hypothetical protein